MVTHEGQITGQRVKVETHNWLTGRAVGTFEGTVVGFTHSVSVSEGFVEERHAIVVQCDDGRFRFASPNDVRVLEGVAV